MNEEQARCYELLGLAPGASAEELKAAHRDLVKVWHPDRFAHDPRLQLKAQEKLKEINEAFELLTSGRTTRRARPAVEEDRHEPRPTTMAKTPPARRSYSVSSVLLAASVCFAVFFVAFYALRARGVAPTRADERTPAASVEAPRGESINQQPQTRKQAERETTEAPVKNVDGAPAADASAARPLPTVTVLIDPTTGLVAAPACPVRSRTTFAAGQEPRKVCEAHRKKPAPSGEDDEDERRGGE